MLRDVYIIFACGSPSACRYAKYFRRYRSVVRILVCCLREVHDGEDGDADELRILSDADNILNLRAHGGSLSFLDTKVG